jgi:hypothetical protein
MNTCFTCRHFRAAVNPATMRVRPSQPGKCAAPLAIVWPKAYLYRDGKPPIVEPQRHIYPDTNADDCKTFTPRNP